MNAVPGSGITVTAIDARQRCDDFLRVPFLVHGNLPHWVPPLWLERRQALSPGATPYLRRARTQWWLATEGRRVVGRISAQIDPLALQREPGIGHFGLLDAEERPEVYAALLGAAESWLRAEGMTRVRGPLNLSVNEESGLLVDGFDTPPMMMMPHNPPSSGPLLEAHGYAKAQDLFAYRLDCSRPMPEGVRKLMERPLPKGLTIRPLRMKEYGDEVATMVDIFNDAWRDNWGFVPFDAEEAQFLAQQLRPLIEQRLVWFAEMDGQAVAFLVCLPNLNEAIADLNGRLLPFGWAKLLWRLKVAGLKTARVPLMGVRKSASASMVGAMLPFLLIGATWPEVLKRRMEAVELSWILENNRPMCAMAESLAGPAYKTYRVYEKALA